MKTIGRRDFLGSGLGAGGVAKTRDAASEAAGERHTRRGSQEAPPGLTREEARELADRILAFSRVEGTDVDIQGGWTGNTRYAVNRITTAGTTQDMSATVTARFGKQAASASTNRLDDASLEQTVRSAEELARLAPEDPELMPLLGPQGYAEIDGYFGSTAGLGADARAEVSSHAIGLATERGGLEAAGFLLASAGSGAIANSAGLFGYYPATSMDYSLTVRTSDGTGSGWAGTGHRDWSGVDARSLHRRAVEKARRSQNPRPLEPGKYTVVLEPAAVSDLVGLLAFAGDARRADEGRSAFSAPGGGTKIGEQIVDPRVTLRSDPAALGAAPFTGDGLPLEPITWVGDGVLQNLYYSRFWAEKQGVEPTGFPTTLIMEGGEGTTEDLVADTERGVLVTRFWYIRSVDPRTILYTGLTRDGTFLIENGEITRPVNNFRWNDSPLFALSNLDAIGRTERVETNRAVPPLRVREFTFSSISEAV